ncbi:cysteine hydrolase family protein [Pelosinus propionicus]|uniref:Nicotinamidase-related amidase n=1 Tax=Pelosinus propionicus DSM 13327 TaxID=1123291 RepID=A0A1I4H2L6_9FIRM|nr:cysteine hydrolase family protein [Pelosinus propionicus]SFL35903.1 Nicotinamidase-related amidase [Pelosinus propionicus DSM 13327]
MNEKLPKEAVLLIIDVQNAIDDPQWCKYGRRNNAAAEENMSVLLTAWRQSIRRVIHVRHESREANSTYRSGAPGFDFKVCAMPTEGELIITKHVNSAFIGTNLEKILRQTNTSYLVIFGVITNNSVEATVRMAGNLGFTVFLVEDATFTFARPDYNGQVRTAEEVHAMSLANLDKEYCTVISSAALQSLI